MKKTLIALAVASALPAVAQADVILSGSVEGKFVMDGDPVGSPSWTVESDLDLVATEELANGMTATATIDISDSTGNTPDEDGTATLSGEFGTLSVGTAGNVQLGADVGDVADQITLVESHDSTDSTAATQTGLSFSRSFSGFDMALNTGNGSNNVLNAADPDDYRSFGIAYDFNDLKVGLAQLNKNGESESAVGAAYTFGELTVSGGTSEGNTKAGGSYTTTLEDLSVTATAANNTDKDNEWEVEATYTMGTMAVKATMDENSEEAEVEGIYTSGAVTATIKKDSVELGYDMGNADFTVEREDSTVKASYKVSF
jgi:hypothetical protein